MKVNLAILICFLSFAPGSATAAEPVTVRAFAEIAVHLEQHAAAQVESLNEAVISAEVNARVVDFAALPGEAVERGQVLLRLNDDSYRIQRESAIARLEMTNAALDMARIRAERARRLSPEQFVSADQLLEAETRLRQAMAEKRAAEQDLAQAELMLERTVIRAPFNGVVSARLIGLGALAAAGTPLIELIALDEIEVVANVAPELIEGLKQAREIHFVYGPQREPVELARVSPVITRSSRQQQVRLTFVGEPAAPGSDGRIAWSDPSPAVPADYVVRRNGVLGVLILDADGSHADFVELPTADAGRPASLDLPADTLLIDQGRMRIQPGDPVRLQ